MKGTRFHGAVDYVLWLVALTCGGLLFSQGVSFAKWNRWATLESQFNAHAELLYIGGLGLGALALLVCRLMQRVSAIEQNNTDSRNVDQP
jgi:hypothetical protein